MNKATYAYCLVAAPRRPSLPRASRALPGAGRVRLLDIAFPAAKPGRDRLWLVVSDVPLARYGADRINAKLSDLAWLSRVAVAHETVVEAFISATAVLPMKLFTIFASDERAASHVSAARRQIERALKRVGGKLEWGVRVVLNRQAKNGAPARRVKGADNATGVAYLARKKALRDRSSELAERSREVVGDLYDRLERRAVLARRRPASEMASDDGSLLLDAAFLVPHRAVSSFRTAVAREARALAPDGYRVTINGPWPPYSFVGE
jgi:hypothetical protein